MQAIIVIRLTIANKKKIRRILLELKEGHVEGGRRDKGIGAGKKRRVKGRKGKGEEKWKMGKELEEGIGGGVRIESI